MFGKEVRECAVRGLPDRCLLGERERLSYFTPFAFVFIFLVPGTHIGHLELLHPARDHENKSHMLRMVTQEAGQNWGV